MATLYLCYISFVWLGCLAFASCTNVQRALANTKSVFQSDTVSESGYNCPIDIPTGAFNYCANCTGSTTTTPGYTITTSACTPTPTSSKTYVTPAVSSILVSAESLWKSARSTAAIQAMSTYFPSAWGSNNTQYNLQRLLNDPPRIGLAFSGGGFRAMLGGAGVMQAFDDVANGGVPGVAGILNSSFYISGLSGGGWLVGSWALNNFTDIQTLNGRWKLSTDLDLTDQWLDYAVCFGAQCEVQQKNRSGAPISFADDWSRLIARNILTNIDAGTPYSSIKDNPNLVAKALPILMSTGRTNSDEYEYTGTAFEITPFTFGSWDPLAIGGFIETRLMGSYFSNGTSPNNSCVNKFDNAGFILGASSLAISGVLVDIGFTIQQASANVPNSFCGFGKGTQSNCNLYRTLLLNDGGDGGQNIPLLPHLQPARGVDAIIAVDMSDDASDGIGICCGLNWPQAYSLNWTLWYANSPAGQAQGIAVPKSLPTPQQIQQNLALVYTPTFFGCNSNDTTIPGVIPPLIIYLPNAPYSAFTNGTTGSTATWEWGKIAKDLIKSGAALGSTGIPPGTGQAPPGTPSWSVCLACALADRTRERLPVARSKQCSDCFTAYCAESKLKVDGLTDPLSGFYSPPSIPNSFGTAQPANGSYCYVSPEYLALSCNWKACNCQVPPACPDYKTVCSSSISNSSIANSSFKFKY